MAFPVTLNGRTYTLTDFEGTNYVDGLPDAFEDFVTHAGDIYNSTSTTSNSIGTGSKTFTVEANKPYQAGTPLRIADAAAPSTNFLDTVVTSYSGTTLVVNSIGYGGSGTKTSWTVNIGGAKTVDGTLGLSQGGTGATDAAGARTNIDVYSKSEAVTRYLNISGDSADISFGANMSFGDNNKIIMGAGSDLQIYHNPTGSHSYITESGGGSLYIQGTELNLTNAAGTSTYANFVDGGAAFIRHAGSTKLATSTTGVDITGGFTATADSIISTDGGNPSMTVKTSGTGNNPSYILRAGDNTVFDIMGIFSSDPDYLRIGKGTTGSVDTEIAKFHVGGDVEIANGNLVVASGHGIDFSATSGTGTSELLSDYEEGTFTPTSPTVSFSASTGSYTKIGRQVFYEIDVTLPSTSSSVQFLIDGMPFSNASKGGAFIKFTTNGTVITFNNNAGTRVSAFNLDSNITTLASVSGRRFSIVGQYFVA